MFVVVVDVVCEFLDFLFDVGFVLFVSNFLHHGGACVLEKICFAKEH